MASVEKVIAAGGVLFRNISGDSEPEIVLIFRRGVWDLPKGKLEEGESIRECAAREVAEEIGIAEAPLVVAKLGDTYHEYDMDATHFGKTTHWFAMKVPSSKKLQFHPQKEENIERVTWQTLGKAKEQVGYENLFNVLEAFEKWIKNRS